MPVIYLYAEVLTNIRQLSLYASLQTEKNEHTKVLISSDKKIITALHDGETASIYLPTQISGTAKLTFPLERKTEISARVQIEDVEKLKATEEISSKAEVPWGANQMSSTVWILCKACKATLLNTERSLSWKDLPSESWAELMDFWFCHKPHDNDDDDHHHAAEMKGFSARSKFVSKSGIGFVDTISFIIHTDDLKGVKVSTQTQNINLSKLQCKECSSILGSANENESNYRLYKSRISVKINEESQYEEFPASTFISAQLLSIIETSISRKVIIHPNTNPNSSASSGLLLWIFNPDIYYSSSRKSPATAYRAMKIFYKAVSNVHDLLDKQTNLEELVVLQEDYDDLVNTLEQSTLILPLSARTFKQGQAGEEYLVGLLDRHETISTGEEAMDRNPLSKKPEEIELFKIPEGMQALYE